MSYRKFYALFRTSVTPELLHTWSDRLHSDLSRPRSRQNPPPQYHRWDQCISFCCYSSQCVFSMRLQLSESGTLSLCVLFSSPQLVEQIISPTWYAFCSACSAGLGTGDADGKVPLPPILMEPTHRSRQRERQVGTRTKEGGGSLPRSRAQIILFVYGVALYHVAQAGLQLTM